MKRVKQTDPDEVNAKNRLLYLMRKTENHFDQAFNPIEYDEIVVFELISFVKRALEKAPDLKETHCYEDIFTHKAFLSELFNSEWGLYIGTLAWEKISGRNKPGFLAIPRCVYPIECVTCGTIRGRITIQNFLNKHNATCSKACRTSWLTMEQNFIRAMESLNKGADFASDLHTWEAYKFLCRKVLPQRVTLTKATYTPLYYHMFPEDLSDLTYPWWVDKVNGRPLANDQHKLMFDLQAIQAAEMAGYQIELIDLDDYLKPEFLPQK